MAENVKMVTARLMNDGAAETSYSYDLTRGQKCVIYLKRFLAFLLSTVGLTITMVLYTLLGGYIFSELEAPHELVVENTVRVSLR